ncbi:hypothetical protein CANCADRAFT_30104 [Tortispora caseinolytica NRRL Y-17796]|uniref:protein disulfide-isomerase n=1 Tax=Tortispora caseinolytica NRRL Y-17796 TaxID=767744 RepID=A0A1E4TJ40_9ASCO|nr:hypothetical protein CANCADRAFT_30104 [Tortispora caseinolytica NRRL Y-17796]
MKFASGFAIALFASLVAADTITATDEDIDELIASGKPTLVKFYASWCSHCRNMAPVYEDLGLSFNEEDVQIVKIDADKNKITGKKFEIQGYPTIKMFNSIKSEDPVTYTKARTLDAFKQFVEEHSGVKAFEKPAAPSRTKEVKPKPKGTPLGDKVSPGGWKALTEVVEVTDGNWDDIVLDKTKHVLLAFTAEWCAQCKKMAPEYEQLAEIFAKDKDVVIARIETSKETGIGHATQYGVASFPTLMLFKKDAKENPLQYKGERNAETLLEYLRERVGTKRTLTGNLDTDAGVVEELNELFATLVEAEAEHRAAVVEEIKTKVQELKTNGTDVDAYEKVLAKLAEDADYIKKEIKRLTALLKNSASLAREKVDQSTIKLNVLKSISEAVSDFPAVWNKVHDEL